MIKVEDLSFAWTDKPLFDKVNFSVNGGEKIGLVGINGAGKSTLFKLICGKENADSGHVIVGEQVIYVPQEVRTDPEMEAAKSVEKYLNPKKVVPDHEIRRVLYGVGLSEINLSDDPNKFSGGQKTRLALARAIMGGAKILLLDEPTNFLDEQGKKWMVDFVGKFRGTLLIISHDINLLSGKLDRIFYINPQTKKIDIYSGNYDDFLKLKAEKEDLLRRQIETQQKHLKQMKQGLLKMAHFKSKKGVKARLNLQRRVEKVEENMPELPTEAKKIKINLPEPLWVGELPVLIKNVSKSFGNKLVLDNINLLIKRGQRIALIGKNGAGKSTLIKIIRNELLPDNGEVIRDNKLKVGYYCQELSDLDSEATLYETIKRLESGLNEGQIRSLLGKMLFTGDKIFQKINSLSGGEKTRLSISRLLAQNFNLLILDEPTTYLDPLSQRLILEAIKQYRGALIIVSHNQEFLDELSLDQKLYLPENKLEIKY